MRCVRKLCARQNNAVKDISYTTECEYYALAWSLFCYAVYREM